MPPKKVQKAAKPRKRTKTTVGGVLRTTKEVIKVVAAVGGAVLAFDQALNQGRIRARADVKIRKALQKGEQVVFGPTKPTVESELEAAGAAAAAAPVAAPDPDVPVPKVRENKNSQVVEFKGKGQEDVGRIKVKVSKAGNVILQPDQETREALKKDAGKTLTVKQTGTKTSVKNPKGEAGLLPDVEMQDIKLPPQKRVPKRKEPRGGRPEQPTRRPPVPKPKPRGAKRPAAEAAVPPKAKRVAGPATKRVPGKARKLR